MNRMSCYREIIVIGYGKITGEIIKYVYQRQKEYGYSIEYIEYEEEPFGATRGICNELGITCHRIEDKKELTDYFLSMEDRCLIVSASNNYLFPVEIAENPQYTVINFHNALLPKFPGRNAPTWAIFENEEETGITWHYVTGRVDGGDIIIQKKCSISQDIRAYELAERLMRLAFEGFSEKFDEILEERVIVTKQQIAGARRLYRSTDKPGDCTFQMEDTPEYIYRLLRAVDYGKYGIFPPVTAVYKEKKIKIIRYRKVPGQMIDERAGRLYLPLGSEFSLMLSWAEISSNSEWGGVIPDIEYFYELMAQIKKADRKYLFNYYLSESVLAKAIAQAEITYVYKEKEYLNLWWQKEHFKRQYYFIADAKHYKVHCNSALCVCDTVCREKDMPKFCELLSNAGMNKYAVYRKWVCTSPILPELYICDDLQIVDDDDAEQFADGLLLYFDKLSDMLPDKQEWEEFIKSRSFIGVHDMRSKMLVAGMVYEKRGCVVIEEFVFVHSGYRGQGISKHLHNALYQKYAAEKIKYTAWIREDNLKSRNLHSHYNYRKQDLFKITFLKKPIEKI